MATTVALTNGVDAFTDSARPNKPLGGPARLPIGDGNRVWLWFPHRNLPAKAVITAAELEVSPYADWPGVRNLTVAAPAAGWDPQDLTHQNSPAVGAALATAAVGGVAGSALVIPGLAALVQSWVNGSTRNRGIRLVSDEGVKRHLRGFDGPAPKPRLVVTYEVPPDPPTELHPDGSAVSVAKPHLTFRVPPGTTAIQVQVATDAAFTNILHDSGTIDRTVGVYDLDTSSWAAGVALGQTVFWRAKVVNGVGTSAWSEVATFPRAAKTVITFTSPGASGSDRNPPVTWTAPGQVERRVVTTISGPAGGPFRTPLRHDTGWKATAATNFTPPITAIADGDEIRYEVQVVDGVDRAATKGDPVEVTATHTYQFNYLAAGLPVADDLTLLDPTPWAPWVHLQIDPGVNLPDEWAFERDGLIVAQVDVTQLEWTDFTADAQREHTWRVLAVVAGEISNTGPTVTHTPTISGVWIGDPETGDDVLVTGRDEVNAVLSQITVIHEPLDQPAFVRTFSQLGYRGDHSGHLDNVYGRLADVDAATLLRFRNEAAQGKHHRVAWASHNIEAALHDVDVSGRRTAPTPGKPRHQCYFGLIQQGD